MSWADFYLICFAVGFAFSFLSFFLGGIHWHLPFHTHLPFDIPHPHVGPHVHAGGHIQGGQARGATAGHGSAPTPHVSPLNPMTLAAFLAWFGGTGYLLTRFSTLRFLLGLFWSVFAGLVAAAIIFLFMTKVLISKEEDMDPADYEMVGILGKISSPMRAGGTGELIYSQAGTRRSCGARTEDGSPLVKGEEVIVTRYERGIAYVRRWAELTGQQETSSESRSRS